MRRIQSTAVQDHQAAYAKMLLQQAHSVSNQRARNRVAKAEMLLEHGKFKDATTILEAICAEKT